MQTTTMVKCPLCGASKPLAKKTATDIARKEAKTHRKRLCRACVSVIARLKTDHSTVTHRKEYTCPVCGKIDLIKKTVYYNQTKENMSCPECTAKKLIGHDWKEKIESLGMEEEIKGPDVYRFFGCTLTRQRKVTRHGIESKRCQLHENCIYYDFCLTVTASKKWGGWAAEGTGHQIQYDKYGVRLSSPSPKFQERWFRKNVK